MPRVRAAYQEELTASEAARRLGLTAQGLQGWLKKPGAPVRADGNKLLVQWPQFARWREQQMVESALTAAQPADFEEARARKVAAEAQLAELDLAVRRGDLVTLAEFEKTIAQAFDRVRSRMVALPGRLAPLVVGTETLPAAVSAIEPVIAEILHELATDSTPVIEEAA